jgi:DNA-binding Lrp family transcriptional regulator
MALADVLDTWIYLGLDRYIIEDLVFACLCIVAGLVSFAMGIRIRNREQRFSRYETIVGSRKSVPIAAIAETMSVSTSAAAKDIEMMVDKGYFGDKAYVDYGKMQLILDADAVDFVPEKEPEEKADSTPEIKDMPDSEREKTLAEIRRLNDAIADEQVSEIISRIEGLTDKILSRVELKPEKKPQIRSFLNYYLPTTLKLLKAYSEFEAQGVEGETITKAKESIAEILDNLIAAFEQQLDQLFSSEAMDISSDIEVLENMMRRDGFSDDGMTLGSH